MSNPESPVTRLEALRKKKRTLVKEGLVRAVMVQGGDFEDKIRRIEMIDLMPEEAAPPQASRKPRGTLIRPEKPEPLLRAPELRPAAVDPDLTEPKRVEHYRRRLTKLTVRGGLWNYLTREYGAMVRFGARTSTLSRGFFPFTLRLSPEGSVFLSTTLKNHILPVLDQTLPLVLRKSWLHLTKYEYNLLVALRDLVRAIGSVEVAEGDRTGGGSAWDPVIPLLRLFWTAGEVTDQTLRAWELGTSKLGVSEKVKMGGADSIRTLLEERVDAQSFPDVLLAIQMLRARRQVDWDDGKPTEPGEYFLRDTFDCPAEVQAEIDRAADILTGQLEVLGREAQEIRRIRYYLPPGDIVTSFVGAPKGDDLALWCQGLLVRLDAAFSPLLEGSVVFADGTQTELFQNPSLSSTLARIRLIEAQLADPTQAANPEVTASAARVVMNLGKTLVVLIRNRSLTADPLARAADTEQLTDPLPFEEAILDRPLDWAGLSVVDALVHAARICLQAGRVLGETSLETSLEKEVSLPGRASDLLNRLSRLVPPARIAGLKARWEGLPLTTETEVSTLKGDFMERHE